MNLLPQDPNGCPFLILAPMEGVGDRSFRQAIGTIGGFDEAVQDFLRVPKNAHILSLATAYVADELSPIPLAPQLMGSDPDLMAEMAQEMEKRGAHRVDLNCGCPSNTVVGRGAGSSLLKEPDHLYAVAKGMKSATSIPITIKMRSGYEDTSLFEENLFAAQESGASFITLHPRTKVEGYHPPAKWELIAKAKKLLQIPVVGNGDILTVNDALQMLKMTRCDGLMIGRGSVINPFLFQEIKAHFRQNVTEQSKLKLVHSSRIGESHLTKTSSSRHDFLHGAKLENYLHTYLQKISGNTSNRTKINKLKQLLGFLFKGSEELFAKRQEILTSQPSCAESLLEFALFQIKH